MVAVSYRPLRVGAGGAAAILWASLRWPSSRRSARQLLNYFRHLHSLRQFNGTRLQRTAYADHHSRVPVLVAIVRRVLG